VPFVLEVDVGERLPVGDADDEAGVGLPDRPGGAGSGGRASRVGDLTDVSRRLARSKNEHG
jgi:hypothetical protein